MEKDQKPIVSAMLKTSFRETLFRSISMLLLNRIYSRFDSISVKADKLLTVEQVTQIKEQYFNELMREEHIKKDLQRDLNDIFRMKGDLIQEILKQYRLNIRDEQEFYHDTLGTLFDHQLWNIRVLISKNRWRELII